MPCREEAGVAGAQNETSSRPPMRGRPAGGGLPGRRYRANVERVHTYVLLALAVVACVLFGVLLWPFLAAIVMSAVMAALVFPAHRRLRRRIRRNGIAALITTIIVFFVVLLPAVGVGMLLFQELQGGLDWLSSGATDAVANAGRFAEWLRRIAARLGIESGDPGAAISRQAQLLLERLAGRTLVLFTGLGGWLIQAGVGIFTLYYLLRDGDALVRYLKWLLPLEPELNDRLFQRATEIIRAAIFGTFIVAAAQGTLGGLIFWALGLSTPVVWGTAMAMLSLLPMVGPGFIWVPAVLVLLATGHVMKALALLAFGALIIATIDNVLRAWLVSGRAQLHPLLVFFSVVGGLFVFGAPGVFVGPVLVVIALTLIDTARLTMEPDPWDSPVLLGARAAPPQYAGIDD
jgi:predicted PurR-regulated permease PerM